MVVKSLLGKASELSKKGIPGEKIVSMLKEKGHSEKEIRMALEFLEDSPSKMKKGESGHKQERKAGKEDLGIEFVEEEPALPEEPKKEADPSVKAIKAAERAPGNANLIETQIDRLHSMINEKGIVRVSEAASALGVKKELVEEWAKVLEESGLILLRYRAVGDIEMLKKEVSG